MAKIYVKSPQAAAPEQEVQEPAAVSFDVVDALGKAELILGRELRNLTIESSKGKLSATSSRDLVAYVRLLNELKANQAEELSKLTDDDLLKLKKAKGL